MEKFLHQLLGIIDIPTYLAGFAFALIGALISLRLHAKKRDKSSPTTPYVFSWTFLIQDNVQRLAIGFLITFIFFRFAPQLLGQEFSMFYALIIGLLNDRLAGILNKVELKARD